MLTPVPLATAAGEGRVCALTFDDGPNGADTEALLDLLAGHGIRAVFAVVGAQITAPGGAELLRRIVREGHVLCNNSTSFDDLGDLGVEEARARIAENSRLIRAALGDPTAPIPYFRAPNGSWGRTAEAAVAEGLQPLAVVNTIGDWMTQDETVLTERLRGAMRPGEVVLVHDGGGRAQPRSPPCAPSSRNASRQGGDSPCRASEPRSAETRGPRTAAAAAPRRR